MIIDPLISYHGGDENNAVETRATLDGITKICSQANCTPILIHHDNKGQQGTNNSYRGSTAINDWARNRISLKHDEKPQQILVTHEKCNDFKKFDSFCLKIDHNLCFNLVEGPIKQKDIEACRDVVKVLSKIGGTAEGQNKLAKAYNEDYGGSLSTAKRNIKNAAKYGSITEIENNRDGKDTYEYTIPEK